MRTERLAQKDLAVFRTISLAAVVTVFILNGLGGIMRVTQSGSACLDWPTCLGSWGLPAQVGELTSPQSDLLVTYAHRLVTVLAGVLILAGAWMAFRRFHQERMLSLPYYAAMLVFDAQIFLGGAVTLFGLSGKLPGLAALHLGLSLVILALLVVPLVTAFYRLAGDPADRLQFATPFAKSSLALAGLIFLVWISGSLVAYLPGAQACSGWPLCLPQSAAGWLNLGHRVMVGLAAAATLGWVVQAWLTQRSHAPVLVTTTAAAVLLFSQALLGARLGVGAPGYMLALHQATAVAVWALLAAQMMIVGLAKRSAADEQADRASLVGRSGRGLLKDFLMLTKPIVVLLLLVTTYAGMVIGARQWPSLGLTLWTMLGGFMAAGGSGAINQYIDRYDDQKMQRTQKRPIPAGRMTPAEGLAFGAALLLASFFLMAALVNLLSALLCLAGMIYYVLIYSIFLKKTTVQNIVIGGGAGAIPPLVGWAAATGSLNVPSLFLFALVFMWTPPHFWALALVRAKDYARAGVPMLPVVRGEKETRWQILLYTVELVVLTLLLPVFGLGSSIYLVGAAVLGAWLLHAAWKVWREGGNKLAWKMYRYSSMYLAFIFVVLMVDRLVK